MFNYHLKIKCYLACMKLLEYNSLLNQETSWWLVLQICVTNLNKCKICMGNVFTLMKNSQLQNSQSHVFLLNWMEFACEILQCNGKCDCTLLSVYWYFCIREQLMRLLKSFRLFVALTSLESQSRQNIQNLVTELCWGLM